MGYSKQESIPMEKKKRNFHYYIYIIVISIVFTCLYDLSPRTQRFSYEKTTKSYAQILRFVSHDPVQRASPFPLMPRQDTLFS